MLANTIDGKALASTLRKGILARVEALREQGVVPMLAVILVGNDPASEIYVHNKELAAKELGIGGVVYRLPAACSEKELINIVERLNADEKIHGILIQLPLPEHVDARAVLNHVSASKDVDGFHILNSGALLSAQPGFVPCTSKGVLALIESTKVPIEGKHAVIVGRSNLVGKPTSIVLLKEDATVSICHSKTRNLAQITRTADILVVAVGKAGLITGDMIKPGAIVIDVGMNRVDGKLCGDVVFDAACSIASYITPVPGGVGPMTITMLMENTVEAAEKACHG